MSQASSLYFSASSFSCYFQLRKSLLASRRIHSLRQLPIFSLPCLAFLSASQEQTIEGGYLLFVVFHPDQRAIGCQGYGGRTLIVVRLEVLLPFLLFQKVSHSDSVSECPPLKELLLDYELSDNPPKFHIVPASSCVFCLLLQTFQRSDSKSQGNATDFGCW